MITSNSHFPKTGFVRISAIIAPNGPIPVSKSTWWQGVRDGRFPLSYAPDFVSTKYLSDDARAAAQLLRHEAVRLAQEVFAQEGKSRK